jgi:hypothetical protein
MSDVEKDALDIQADLKSLSYYEGDVLASAALKLIEALTAEREFFEEEWVSAVDKLNKAVKALLLARVHVANNEQGWSVGRASARSDLEIINATLAEIEGEKG